MNTEEVCTEKSEVIDAILAAGGSSHCTCAVCYEDYQAGDVMRVSLKAFASYMALYIASQQHFLHVFDHVVVFS